MGVTNCTGVQDTLSEHSISMEAPGDKSTEQEAGEVYGKGNRRPYTEGSSGPSPTKGRPVYLHPFSGGKRKWKRTVSTSDQPAPAQPVCTDRVLSDGGPSNSKEPDPTRRLPDETGLERCLLYSTSAPRASPLSLLLLSRYPLRVLLPILWPVISAEGLYKASQTSGNTTPLHGNLGCHLFGRHLTAQPGQGGAVEDLQQSVGTSSEFGVHYQAGEMLFSSHSAPGLFGGSPQLSGHDNLPPIREVECDYRSSPGNTERPGGNRESFILAPWSVESCGTNRSLDCTPPLQEHSAATRQDGSPSLQMADSYPSIPVTEKHRGTNLVAVSRGPDVQWSALADAGLRYDYLDGCFTTWLGSNMARDNDWRSMVTSRSQIPYQPTRAQGSSSSITSLLPNSHSNTETHLTTDGQFDSSGVCEQTRRDKVVQLISGSSGVMGTGSSGRLLDYRQTYPRNIQHNSRFGFSSVQQLLRMDAEPRCVSPDNATTLSTESGSFCHLSQTPSSAVCIQIPRSGSHGNGCIPLRLESVEELDLCTTSPSAEDHPENPEGRGDSTDIGTSLDGSTMVPEPSRDTSGLPTTVTTDPTLDHPSIPTREGTSTSTLTAVVCMVRVRENYRADGPSETATNVLLSSWSDSTQKRYSGPWNAWSSWCLTRSICPFTAPVNSMLTFLVEIAKRDKLAYKTIGVYKSAISQTHDPIGSVPLGELPIVSRFMKGVFRMNPPQPKLCTTWKVQVALDYLKRQRPVVELSLREISGNLVLLLALTSAARAHELAALDLDHLTGKEDSLEFTLAIHVKQSRPGHPARKIYLPVYPVDRKLCVVTTLRAYGARTMAIRQSSKLLLVLIAPHAPISSQTVSRWLRNILNLAGINPTFTGHSTRSASTTAAAEAGIPLELILDAADWSSAGTFRAHYLRPTSLSKETFANSVIFG